MTLGDLGLEREEKETLRRSFFYFFWRFFFWKGSLIHIQVYFFERKSFLKQIFESFERLVEGRWKSFA